MEDEQHPDVAVLVQVVERGRRNPLFNVKPRFGHRRQSRLSGDALTMDITGVRHGDGFEVVCVSLELLPARFNGRSQLLPVTIHESEKKPAPRAFGPLAPSIVAFLPFCAAAALRRSKLHAWKKGAPFSVIVSE